MVRGLEATERHHQEGQLPHAHGPGQLSRLAGSRIFSAVDMQGAFHCIWMDDRDQEKTAFATPFGSFRQKMPGFGVTNGPPTYCRLFETVLRGIPSSVAIGFLDDGLIHSETVDQHVTNLRRVLSAYRNADLKLSLANCTFFADRIVFLGHGLRHDGIRPAESHVKAVEGWTLPSTKT